jgi:hypothetical protein
VCICGLAADQAPRFAHAMAEALQNR